MRLAFDWTGKVHRLQNRLKPLAADDVEQGEGRAFGLLGAALQLRDVADAQVESAGEGGLAHVGALPQAANFFALDGFGRGKRLRAEQAHGDFFVALLCPSSRCEAGRRPSPECASDNLLSFFVIFDLL